LDAVKNGKRGAKPLSLSGLGSIRAGIVDEAVVESFDRRLDLRHMDHSSRWATVAARLAMREAGFPEKPAALAGLGLFLHLATGPSSAESEFLTSFLSHNHQVSQLVAFPYIVPSSVAGNVCRALRLTGHNLTLSLGPGAGLLGLGPAVAALRNGHAEALLSGAVDELSERILTDNVMAGRWSKDGPPPGEGAAILLLETLRHATARGVRPLAIIRGMSFATEPPNGARLDSTSKCLEETVREAVTEAGIVPEQAGALCAYGDQARLNQLMTHVCPAWAGRVVAVADHTGLVEGAQPLFDVATALAAANTAANAPFILAIVSSQQGVNGAVVFQRSA
jgi:3-oxoacyl-[acyl-carrier-protein] synthase II